MAISNPNLVNPPKITTLPLAKFSKSYTSSIAYQNLFLLQHVSLSQRNPFWFCFCFLLKETPFVIDDFLVRKFVKYDLLVKKKLRDIRHSLGRKIKSHFCRKEKTNKNNNTRLVNRFTLSVIDLDLSYQDLSWS